MISKYLHETLLAMGFDYEESIDAYFLKKMEDYITDRKELESFDMFPFDAKIYDQEEIIPKAAEYIWRSAETITNEYRKCKVKELFHEIFGWPIG